MKTSMLKRNRINHMLSGIYQYPLTVVEAPAGFGKTVAVKSFLAAEKIKSIWISFQSSMDKMDYWKVFEEEIDKLGIMSTENLISLSFPKRELQREIFISIMSSIKLREKLVIVLDNYQNVNSLHLQKLIIRFSEEYHDNISIIVITRVKLNLPLDEMVSKGLCQLISQSSLRFTGNEIHDYCLLMDKNVSEQNISRLTDYSNGCISMLYMLLLGLKKGIPVGLNINIIDLIDQTFFQVYNPAIQNFLIRLSIVDWFTVELARSITEDIETDGIIKKLKDQNAFIYYDDVNNEYVIYAILLDFLRMKQNFTKEELRKMALIAGEWYLEKRDFLKAYEYFNRVGEHERILMHLNGKQDIQIQLYRFRDFFELFRSISRGLLEQYPIAYLKFILVCMINNKIMAAECNKQLDRLEQIYSSSKVIDLEYKNCIMSEISMTRIFLAFNRTEESIANIDCIPKLLRENMKHWNF